MNTISNCKWETTNFQDFWAEIAPKEHLVQVYESEKVFMNTLEGFVGSGLLAGDTVIIIATKEHISELTARLEKQSLDSQDLVNKGKFFPLDAHQTLSKFMVNGWPDEQLFFKTVSELFKVAKKPNSKIRAFGEMVSLLWGEGNYA